MHVILYLFLGMVTESKTTEVREYRKYRDSGK